MILVPLGILSVRAVDLLWGFVRQLNPPSATRRNGFILGLVLVLFFAYVFASLAEKMLYLALMHRSGDERARLAYYDRYNSDSRMAVEEVRFLNESDSLRGDIYVCGNPIFYLFSGRSQAVALNGWALELYLPEMWSQLVEQLDETQPPYIFVETSYREIISDRSPEMMRFLDRHYRVLRESRAGVWYIVRAQ